MVDIGVSKSPAGNSVRVRVPPAVPPYSETLAYIVGVALGDGNLSNPNGRATRLRITCDTRYPNVIHEIRTALEILFPNNKVSLAQRMSTYLDISVYSNKLNEYLPWQVGLGPKKLQRARVPTWILNDADYARACLRGLIQTDGCIYTDRGYRMVNFTNDTAELAEDVSQMINSLGFKHSVYKLKRKDSTHKYTVRVSSRAKEFMELIGLTKT